MRKRRRRYLGFYAGVLDEGARVGDEAAHGRADMRVDFHNLLNRAGLEQHRGDALLDGQNNALGGLNADGGGAELTHDSVRKMSRRVGGGAAARWAASH